MKLQLIDKAKNEFPVFAACPASVRGAILGNYIFDSHVCTAENSVFQAKKDRTL